MEEANDLASRRYPGDVLFFNIFTHIYIYITKSYLFMLLLEKKSDVRSFSTFNDLGLRLLAMGCIQALHAKLFLIHY